jgi:hypothetical protein
MASAIESLPPPGWDRPELDPLLSLLPAGQLTEIVGSRSSGATSLLLALLARATRTGGLVALVDAADTFDPVGASAAGVDLSAVLWVRCGGRVDAAFRAVDLLARCPGFALVALDVGSRGHRADATPARWLRLSRAVEGSRTVLVARTPERLTGSVAALVLAARRARARWVGTPRPTRLAGLISHVEVTRARRAPSAIPPVSSIEWPA